MDSANDIASPDHRELHEELAGARAKLDRLVRDLRAVDDELAELSEDRHRHELLCQACGALEELRELGAAEMFWGDRLADGEAENRLRLVRGRLDAFDKRVDEVESRRVSVLEEIDEAQACADWLEDDVFEARQEVELRKLEWIVERDDVDLAGRPLRMPWTRGGDDDERLRRSLLAALLVSLLLGLTLPLVNLPLPEAWEPVEVPERLARLIHEQRPLPPAPPVQETATPQEEKPVEPVEELVAESVPKESPQPEAKAPAKGILAFREKFSDLADMKPDARLGAQASVRNEGTAAVGTPERSMVTTLAPGSSGGINLASLSRDVGGGPGGQLEGVQVARATSSIGAGGGQGRPLAGGPGLGRTDEEIQIVFDRHKSALYRLYNRELRRDPTLKGQMILRIRIEPDGSVSLCELKSSDMNAPRLASRVVDLVPTFDFGAKEGIPAITILYPIDFLPAT